MANINENTAQLRENCASKLLGAHEKVNNFKAFIGLDGFVDEIIHAVDKRISIDKFDRIPTISKFAERLAAAAGRSTNVELVRVMMKLGGNGPIMANALAAMGMRVTYLGALGWPNVDPVFEEFTKRAEVHSIANPGHTDALEFEDGKLLFGKLTPLNEVNWENIVARFGRGKFESNFNSANLVGFVNWTMLPYMSDIWKVLLKDLCPQMKNGRRPLFVDLADPEKRKAEDLREAINLLIEFNKYFDVIFGMNEKESYEVGKVLGIDLPPHTQEGVCQIATELNRRIPVSTIVVHPTAYAVASSNGKVTLVEGPFTPKPLITTGAGDHFNAGFCLGKMLGLDNAMSLLCGVSTSGFYVRTAKSPSVSDLAGIMKNWPSK
ncbi:MAG: PfkB family carbohydrate kinase [Verrucomicrobiae bacterium]|nr:PfkB family carbohydrate kinase [Verrucomicrobiae bacterium]